MQKYIYILFIGVALAGNTPTKAQEVAAPDFDIAFCDESRPSGELGLIVHLGTRYIRKCKPPVVPHGQRTTVLIANEQVLIEELGITAFRVIRFDERGTYDDLVKIRIERLFPAEGVRFGGVDYKRYDNPTLNYAGEPTASVFLFEPEDESEGPELPRHMLDCDFPNTADGEVIHCFLTLEYKDLRVSLLVFQGGDLFIQTPFEKIPNVARDMMKLIQFSDVTDVRDLWPSAIPVIE